MRESHGGGDSDRWRQEFVVHVVIGVGGAGRDHSGARRECMGTTACETNGNRYATLRLP